METLTLNMPTDMYQQLVNLAGNLGKPPQMVALEWLRERLSPPPLPVPASEEDIGGQALRAAGLLTELSPALCELADPTVRLEEVVAAMSQAGGPSLSEIVLEERRAREW